MSPVLAGVLQLLALDRRARPRLPSPRRLHGHASTPPTSTCASRSGSTGASAPTRTPRCAGPRTCAASSPSPPSSVLFLYLLQRLQGHLPLLARLHGDRPGPGVQHRRVLRHQHQLAVVLRRADHGPRRADGRPGGAELRLRRRRHRGRRRAGPRLRPLPHRRARQLLGRPGARHASASCCRSRSSPRSCWSRAAPSRTSPASTRSASSPAARSSRRRSGRLAGGHQGARHQRRRLLQRQLRPPLREPDRLHEPLRDLPAAGHPVRADPHLRHAWSATVRQGYAILAAMGTIWVGFIALMMWTEFAHHGPALQIAGRRDGGQGDPLRRRRLVALRGVARR